MFHKFWLIISCVLLLAFQALAQTPQLMRVGPALEFPWGMDFLDDDRVLVTERIGGLHLISLSTGEASEITNLPEVVSNKQGGLLDILAKDGFIYLCYSKDIGDGIVTAIDRATLSDTALVERKTIFETNTPSWSSVHFGCRLAIHDGYLFASLGERGVRDNAQEAAIHDGSIIRIFPDGSLPLDNPRLPGWTQETFSIGHRNPQGMAIHPKTGAVWTHEHGPKGGDEINIIIPGANFGWPKVSHGREYGTGFKVSKTQSLPGLTDPKWVWVPSIAPSGMAFYPAKGGSSKMFPELEGSLLIGSLKFRQLYQVELAADGLPSNERVLIDKALGRIRDVAVARDGSILLLNDANSRTNPTGGLYRVSR